MTRIPIEGQVREIAVFRALGLGDMLCAVPALRSWRHAFPQARITLIGLAWAQELARRLSCVDGFIAFPGCPGVPEPTCNRAALRDFLVKVLNRRFDLAVQMHGSGQIVNALVASFGAGQNAGFRDAQAWYPRHDGARFVAWPHEEASEVERLLRLSDGLGLPRHGSALEFPLKDEDRQPLVEAWPEWVDARPYACLHIGSQPHSERWEAGRFAAVADELAGDGRTLALSGNADEREFASAVIEQMRAPAINLAGKTSPWVLGALLQGAECVVVCDDPTVTLIADALKCRCVVVSTTALAQEPADESAGSEESESASSEMIDLDDWVPTPQSCEPSCQAANIRA